MSQARRAGEAKRLGKGGSGSQSVRKSASQPPARIDFEEDSHLQLHAACRRSPACFRCCCECKCVRAILHMTFPDL